MLEPTQHPNGVDIELTLVDNPDYDDDGNKAFVLEGVNVKINDSDDFDYELNEVVEATIKASSVGSLPVEALIRVELIDDRNEDFDQDGLSEADEEDVHGTSDLLRDSDSDGFDDAYEIGVGRFSIVLGRFNYNQAEEEAKDRNGHLATFATEAEWRAALQSVGVNPYEGYASIWIGAEKRGDNWFWNTGEKITYERWGLNRGSYVRAALIGEQARGRTLATWYTYEPSDRINGYFLETGYPTDPTKADTDGDGVNDKEEVENGTNPLLAEDLFEGDEDRDGWQDETEILFGSSPSDPESVPAFELKLQEEQRGEVQVLFPGEKGVSYTIQLSSDLENWSSLKKLIIGEGATISESFQISGGAGFFRILKN